MEARLSDYYFGESLDGFDVDQAVAEAEQARIADRAMLVEAEAEAERVRLVLAEAEQAKLAIAEAKAERERETKAKVERAKRLEGYKIYFDDSLDSFDVEAAIAQSKATNNATALRDTRSKTCEGEFLNFLKNREVATSIGEQEIVEEEAMDEILEDEHANHIQVEEDDLIQRLSEEGVDLFGREVMEEQLKEEEEETYLFRRFDEEAQLTGDEEYVTNIEGFFRPPYNFI